MTIVLIGLACCVAATVINLLIIVLVWRRDHRVAHWSVAGLALGLASLLWGVSFVMRSAP